MYNIFYVESPLQLLSAISANKAFKEPSILIVKMSSTSRLQNNKQMMALIDKNLWSIVYFQKKHKIKLLATYVPFFYMLTLSFKYKNKVNRYFFGEFRGFDMSVMGGLVNAKESVLLDDGSFTIIAQKSYIKKNIFPYKLNGSSRRIKFLLCKMIFGLSQDKLQLPNLYSFFKLNKSLVEGQVNYYAPSALRSIVLEPNNIYYFGSKFSEVGYLKRNTELNILKKVFNMFGKGAIYYIPHRDEKPEKLNDIEDIGYIIKNLGCPAEVFFQETNIMPHTVISCYSTVLYSSFSTFKNVKNIAIDISNNIENETLREVSRHIYTYYQEVGIEVINIP